MQTAFDRSRPLAEGHPLARPLGQLAWRPLAVFGALAAVAVACALAAGARGADRVLESSYSYQVVVGYLISWASCAAPCVVLVRATRWRALTSLWVFLFFTAYLVYVWFGWFLLQVWAVSSLSRYF